MTNATSFRPNVLKASIGWPSIIGVLLLAIACGGGSSRGEPSVVSPAPVTVDLDLNDAVASSAVTRVYGSVGSGRFGVPIAGGLDIDGDGHLDVAMAAMRASPLGRADAGQVFVLFGDSTTGATIDTAQSNNNALRIYGAASQENAGSEIWVDDVTGDGLGDILIGRQNFNAPGRIGAGALSIIVGSAELANMAADDEPIDLAAPPVGVNIVTFVGGAQLDRLGMWMRTGDIDGDGVIDLVIGADQADTAGVTNAGTAYVVLGGTHLDADQTIDLASFGSSSLVGKLAKLNPPSGSANYHFGASLAVGDLDANGRSEIHVAASLNRAGGTLPAAGAPSGSANGSGANPGGSLFVFWDDNFPSTPWPAGYEVAFSNAPGSTTRINGGSLAGVFMSDRLGEEVLAPADYDGDGRLDLFVGDISGSPSARSAAGLGHVLFDAVGIRDQSFTIDSPPAGLTVTHVFGPTAGAIFGDTAAQGDFNGDGLIDLAVGSPHDSPLGRAEAGSAQILWGQSNWPDTIDLATGSRPSPAAFSITDIVGALGGTSSADHGDTLMYSGTAADIDQDGRSDLIINEMQGNGVAASALDVGNLIIIPGRVIPE